MLLRSFFLLLVFSNITYAQNRYAVDPYGNKIVPATLPKEFQKNSKRMVSLKEMDVGERVQTFADAMIVDENGACWLKPDYVVFPLKHRGELEITRYKLGYTVRVNYKQTLTSMGYAVPRKPQWEHGQVPPNYIPVKSVVVDKPYVTESPSDRISRQMQQPYEPNYVKPKVPPNPYSLELRNDRSDASYGSRRPSQSNAASSPARGTEKNGSSSRITGTDDLDSSSFPESLFDNRRP